MKFQGCLKTSLGGQYFRQWRRIDSRKDKQLIVGLLPFEEIALRSEIDSAPVK
jgi:hypothetical protein